MNELPEGYTIEFAKGGGYYVKLEGKSIAWFKTEEEATNYAHNHAFKKEIGSTVPEALKGRDKIKF